MRGRVEILRRYFGCIQSYFLSSASFLSLNTGDEVAKLSVDAGEKKKRRIAGSEESFLYQMANFDTQVTDMYFVYSEVGLK
jgi:hypothetical protein